MTQLRVRARAVDMLGRQQIAGIPTAIHELFKNAHDAYATRAEVDFFRRNRVLVLRDDGYGMTREDVENRWLTLGTESRVNANREKIESKDEWRGPLMLPKRVIMGEKGIGRLAIAVIAPITILMTRASRPDGLQSLVVALVHWGLFEQPGLDISAIDIPIEEFAGGTLPTREDIGRLVDRVSANLQNLKSDIASASFKQLVDDLELARGIGPDNLSNMLSGDAGNGLSLSGEGYGTHFIMLPVAPELDDDIDGGADKESSKLERNLLGFSNTMAFDEPVIRTEFRDHFQSDVLDLIGSKNFFVDDDFLKTDQYFEGKFDEYGQFVGFVSVYGKRRDFVCNWTDGKGRQPKCGSFSFRYGYVQGKADETSLTPQDWAEMDEKTNRLGGLYIYRDGIRILPYGNSDYDWLDIEKRRNLAAKDWFFSYRRGFGYVSISHSENGALTEKAGREGFRENQAYRDFRAILINFFRQLAYEFFRKSSPQGDDFWAGKNTYAAQAVLLKKQQEKADGRRGVFRNELEQFFDDYNSGVFESESKELLEFLEERLNFFKHELDLGDFASRVRLLELEVKRRARVLSEKAVVSLPRGLALPQKLQKDWSAYESISAQVCEKILDPLRNKIDEILRETMEGKIEASERRSVALQDVERERDNTVRELVGLRRETVEAADFMQLAVKSVLQEEFSTLRANIERLVDGFTKRSAENPEEIDQARYEVEQRIADLRNHESELLESFKRQMIELAEGVKSRETLDDRFAALEARNQSLEEQIEFYSEFAQMGMSVGMLQHEFHGAARGIRGAMAELKPWADRNAPLASIYQRLRDHIEHLDGYLKVLDPLGRRMHRSVVEISGNEILNVLRNVFVEPLESSSIRLEPTYAFRGFKVKCKSSALLGAFINVIDNAIYWLNSRAEGDKKIILDADDKGFLISNNGPGIEERMMGRIFDFGETQKVGGRGMGLAISRDALKREGFNIELVKAGLDVNPQFRISAMDEQGE
ncbi:ATP-binding protein [Pseudomonas gingeri]|uniref:ATP-binding protein n=1 Tax=Pseudomonas gingeri TaxID=117681 RepID=UPI0015A3A7EA|nr:ATP-binding protein [Pseudomonas gingeri]NWA02876.1 ATP-binding protein [Pseudomonas gingeri]NWA17039.1 ATP-binding protein [Pseudomonas gingeri]NWA58490.1 ATP-binding protein [Pseudomonas gingeri]NWA97884.1 ATP-binding protein [Pseudomonas gingeri]NWB06032.1 ATP-binding protein [Pseudomonas gingeri]